MAPVAALPHGDRVTVGQALAHRRVVRRQAEAARRARALSAVAEEFRRRAADHPGDAAPYLDEAELFDSAASRVLAL